MTPVFADASYYVAILSPRDQKHGLATQLSTQLFRPIVVTEFVLVELANALSPSGARRMAIDFWTHIAGDPLVTIVPVSTELLGRGFQLYSSRLDKD